MYMIKIRHARKQSWQIKNKIKSMEEVDHDELEAHGINEMGDDELNPKKPVDDLLGDESDEEEEEDDDEEDFSA